MRSYLKHNRPMIFVVLGSLLFATSVLWEYARMNPQYRYIVSPWSMRGYETVQGLIFVLIAVVVLALALLLTTGIVKETMSHNLGVAAVITIIATLIPVFADAKDIEPGWPVTWGLAFLAAMGARVLSSRFLPGGLQGKARALSNLAVFLVALVATGTILGTAFSGKPTPVWTLVLIAALLLDVLVLFREPGELSSYRTLINITVAGWLMSMASAAAVRVTLQQAQFEEIGIAPNIDDVAVTSGMLIAWFGGLVMFIGAVSLWAGRREQLSAELRARTQLDMARASAEELGEKELHVAADLEEVIGGV